MCQPHFDDEFADLDEPEDLDEDEDEEDEPLAYTVRCPLFPTHALPGTPEKIRVMTERVARGEAPFHPLDPRIDSRYRRSDS